MERVSVTPSHLSTPLDAVLGSPGMLRLLRVLIRHGGFLSLPRLAANAGLSPPGAGKGIAQLTNLGMVRMIGSGRARLYGISGHPVVGMLTDLFDAEADYRATIMTAITQSATDLGIEALWLFGSAALREDRPASDLDLFLVTRQHGQIAQICHDRLADHPLLTGLKPSILAFTQTELALMIHEQSPVWAAVVRDAVVLIGPPPADLAARLRHDEMA